jgi:hypothetical protein
VFLAAAAQPTSAGAKPLGPREEISLHTSEGFCRGMAEALQLGVVDLIATAYGGNTSFCAGPLAHPLRRLLRWGETDLEHAADLMQQVAASPSRDPAVLAEAVNHRLDGVFWPRGGDRGTPEQPVVLLEVQMHSKVGFKHRLGAQSFRFLQLHPHVQHLAVVVLLPHRRLRLGPAQVPHQLQAFVAGVHWLSLEELGQKPGLDPLVSLLTLPVLPKPDIPGATEQILQPRPDLIEAVLSILGERFPHLTREEIMALINLPTGHLRHTRAVQEWMEEGRLS